MAVTKIEVLEYNCELCGYKWISRVNGEDKPKPKRCAKCKDERWEKGKIHYREKEYRDFIRRRFGYYEAIDYHGGWQLEDNAKRFLAARPSFEELRVIVEPLVQPGWMKDRFGNRFDREFYKRNYELQRYNLQSLMEQHGIPYDSNELARIEMGSFAIKMGRCIPKYCEAIKAEHPEYSNEQIKTDVVNMTLSYLKEHELASKTDITKEVIELSWPDWIK